jgi:hypothetical protein
MAEPGTDENENPEIEEPQEPPTFFTAENVEEIWSSEEPVAVITQMLVPKLPDLAEH